jgi:hypothetical protein
MGEKIRWDHVVVSVGWAGRTSPEDQDLELVLGQRPVGAGPSHTINSVAL